MVADCGLRMNGVKGSTRLFRNPRAPRGAAAILLLFVVACASNPEPASPGATIRVPRFEFVPESETFAAAVGVS